MPLNAVGKATSYGLDGGGDRFLAGRREFSLLDSVQTDFETHPALYPVGTRGSFPGVK
jgi:hypothetical protein